LINHLLRSPETSKLLEWFHGSKSAADTAPLRRLESSRSAIKIHAEIKLLFYYETHPKNVRPRIICANKSAYYLCDLFIRVHGEFQTPRTFGKFIERWILPDWLETIPSDRFQTLRDAVEQFSTILDSEIGLALKSFKRLPDPLESAVGFSAQWSNSTVDNGPFSRRNPSTDEIFSAQEDLQLNPSFSKSVDAHQFAKVSQPCSINLFKILADIRITCFEI
jgi:hypothetical protein